MKALAEKFLSYHVPKASDYAKKYEVLISKLEEEVKVNQELEVEQEMLMIQEQGAAGEKEVEEVITALKAYRLQKSREESVKPYFIFNNKQMMNLIDIKPKTKEELLSISGFGEVKVQKYGEEILRILK